MDGMPVFSTFCRLDPEKFAAAKAEFDQLEREAATRYQDAKDICKTAVITQFGLDEYLRLVYTTLETLSNA
jgi:hypothetical protein